MTFAAIRGSTWVLAFNTRDTVEIDTPAARATSTIVATPPAGGSVPELRTAGGPPREAFLG
jgi:hypothetical protein